MDANQVSMKLFAIEGTSVDGARYIELFHRWIRENRLGDRLLLDVADYRHVHHGPGVMLIGHHGHFAMDDDGGRHGMLFARKRDEIGPVGPRLAEAAREVLTACQALEEENLGVRFDPGRLELRIVNRLVAHNDDATHAAFVAPLRAFLEHLYPDTAHELHRTDDPRAPFGVEVHVPDSPELTSLLERSLSYPVR